MPHLLYIGQTPAEGTGSPVIILRHLLRLAAAGWRISLVAEGGHVAPSRLPADWTVLSLPLRRSWWPPFRLTVPISRTVRTWLLAGECQRLTVAAPPDAVLGYLAAHDDFYAEIAACYARRSGTPLSLLVHDDAAAFTTEPGEKLRRRRRHATMLHQAHRCWFVSPELADVYGLPVYARRVLPPIPAVRPNLGGGQAAATGTPRVYYAGFIWPVQYPLLDKIARALAEAGASLVLLTRETPELRQFLRTSPVAHVPPFATNAEALAHLAREAAGLIVAYADSVAQMPWIATSFPSKLVEYAQLGLPCAIVAPPDSAVGRWAHREGYEDFFTPGALPRLSAWARGLRTESAWLRGSARSRQLSGGEFNAERIQAAFTAGLLRN